jgi:AraC family transcriptional regulator of adaptative response / DNA-3-methyladenine glycosylase II
MSETCWTSGSAARHRGPVTEFEAMYRAVESRDPRWDGRVFVGVTSTGIYCRPICPVPMPRRENVRFYVDAAAAEGAGFRACRRCRPEQSPDSPDWDVRGDVVGRALRMIATGDADDDGVEAIASRLAVSSRHLHRLFVESFGVGPREIAQSRRAGLAKQLLDQTDLTSTAVAFAAGFRSVRAYNAAVRRTFGRAPTEIRAARGTGVGSAGVHLRLAYRPPLAAGALLGFLADRAIPGVETADETGYRRAVSTAEGPRLLAIEVAEGETDAVRLSLDATSPGELAPIVRAARRLFDLDADPVAIDASLTSDHRLASLVRACPGRRLPGAFDAWATTILAVLGQGVSVAHARAAAGRIATAHGTVVDVGWTGVDRLFPAPSTLAAVDLGGLGIAARRAETIVVLARAVAEGRIDLERGSPAETLSRLQAIPGIGPWTAGYVALRVLRDPDAFPPGDAAVRAAFRRLDLADDAAAILRVAEAWRPWRGYAVAHLWATAG